MQWSIGVPENLPTLKRTGNTSKNFISNWLEKIESGTQMACLRESAMSFFTGDWIFFSTSVERQYSSRIGAGGVETVSVRQFGPINQ